MNKPIRIKTHHEYNWWQKRTNLLTINDCMSPVCCSPVIEVLVTRGMRGVQKLWSFSSMGRGDPSPSIPSCMMTKLSLVRGALNPKCKDLMLCSRDRKSLLSAGREGGRAWRAKWVGGGRASCLAGSLVIFPREKLWESCSENHCTDLLCNDKEITWRGGHSWVWALFNSRQGSHNWWKVGLWRRVLPGRDWHKRNGDS